MGKFLDEVIALGIENVFAITGDYPKGAPLGTVGFACDSVQLVETIAEQRAQGRWPFFISVAVSPFKYTEADCAYQYLKLEKKIAAGADFAITQLGFDSRKYRELKRYLDERGLKTPMFGNVYVLPPKAAERMSKGDPPGCWVSPELLARIQEEAKVSGQRLGRAAGTRRADGGDCARPGIRRRLHRRHARARSHPLDHPASGRIGAALGGTGRGNQLRRKGRLLLFRGSPARA